jgi:hypothetical protein
MMSLGGLFAIAAACVPPGEELSLDDVLDDPEAPRRCPMPLKCDVCDKDAVGVASSTLVPMSFAYCTECNAAGREPYRALVGGLMTCTSDPTNWAPWVMKVAEPTLKFYGKTLADLKQDIHKAWVEYDADLGAPQ